MYSIRMNAVTVTEARKSLPDLVERARREPVVLSRHGKRAAVLMSPDAFDEMLEALEEVEDIAAFDAAMAEEGENIPWDEVKAELGWL